MSKQGLIRIPFYPQFNCLLPLHPYAPLVSSALLFWMTKGDDTSFYPVKHSYQLALHLGISLDDFNEVLSILKNKEVLIPFERIIKPKQITNNSQDKIEHRFNLNLHALQSLLKAYKFDIDLKLLEHAGDDSFDLYDVIDNKRIPIVQKLIGTIQGENFNSLAFKIAYFCVQIMDKDPNFAHSAFSQGWAIMLIVPPHKSQLEHDKACFCLAQEIAQRFLAPKERAIDMGFYDGNFFLPDFNEIKNKEHIIKHYRKHQASRILAAALLQYIQSIEQEHFVFISELDQDTLQSAQALLDKVKPYLYNAQ